MLEPFSNYFAFSKFTCSPAEDPGCLAPGTKINSFSGAVGMGILDPAGMI